MIRNIVSTLLISISILSVQMYIHKSEESIGAFPNNLFTSGQGHWIQYMTWCNPETEYEFFEGTRTHYGFPFPALYIDKSNQSNAWYAKLDIFRLTSNYILSLLTAILIMGGYLIIKKRF